MNDSNPWGPESRGFKCPHCHYQIPINNSMDRAFVDCIICGQPLNVISTFCPVISTNTPPRTLRLLARGIDYLLIAIGLLTIDSFTGRVFHRAFHWLHYGILTVPQVTTPLLLIYGVSCIYFVLFHSLSGQTIGKWCCGLIVLSSQLRRLSVFRQILREFIVGLTFVMEWLWLILLFSSKKRGFHDWITGSQVYSVLPPEQDPVSTTTGIH